MMTDLENLAELERISNIDCGAMTDDNHDCDHCPSCLARQIINEAGEIVSSGLQLAHKLQTVTK